MPLSTDPQDEVKKVQDVINTTDELRTRMDDDWGLFRLDEEIYSIPTAEGEWDRVISNRAPAEGNKIIDYLSYARRKLWIPLTEEKHKGRKSLTSTALGSLKSIQQ